MFSGIHWRWSGTNFSPKDLQVLMEYGDYRWLIVHQRGYYLTDPNQGDVLYRDVIRNLSDILAVEPEKVIEQEAFEWYKNRAVSSGTRLDTMGFTRGPKTSKDMPRRYEMAIFDLSTWNKSASLD